MQMCFSKSAQHHSKVKQRNSLLEIMEKKAAEKKEAKKKEQSKQTEVRKTTVQANYVWKSSL